MCSLYSYDSPAVAKPASTALGTSESFTAGNIASSLISDADGFESVLCCRCVAKNNFPVSAFNYQQIMKQFQERCIYTQGDFECHYCTADDGQLNVLDILQVSMYREYWRLWRGYFTAVY